MSFAFWACLYQERRRLALVTALAFVAGVLFYLPSQSYVGRVHISLLTGTVYAAVVGLASAIVCVLLPRLRFMIEAVAVSRLILACCVVVTPEIGPLLLGNPLVMATVVVLGGAGISRLMHGQLVRGSRPAFAFGPSGRRDVVVRGGLWQRSFVDWIEAAPSHRFAT
ncbi:MAG: hypothetical protein AAF230_08475 [Pseudomonadota bacterium]